MTGTETETLLQQGVNLMLFGMLTVVMFLGLLVVAVSAMSALVARFAPAPTPAPEAPAMPGDLPDPAVVAAITAAIAVHRARRQGARHRDEESR